MQNQETATRPEPEPCLEVVKAPKLARLVVGELRGVWGRPRVRHAQFVPPSSQAKALPQTLKAVKLARLVVGKPRGVWGRPGVRHAQLVQRRLQPAVLHAVAVHRQEYDRARLRRGLRPVERVCVPVERPAAVSGSLPHMTLL